VLAVAPLILQPEFGIGAVPDFIGRHAARRPGHLIILKTALPVTHDHALGSCTGTLKFNGYVIAFLPTAGFKDAFKQGLSELEFSDKLTALQRENVSLRVLPS
jgi:hypothetical protein